MTPRLLSHLFSLAGESPIKTRCIDDRLSFKRARHRRKKKSLLKALSGKEAEAQSEEDAFVEHCAKRWQTREGTYQLKRRRLKPDVRDPPEDISADVDMADI